jgi:photosystem II stability/assembly factor-like uncharacterized protein
MVDEHGRIPPGARYAANAERRSHQQQHGKSGMFVMNRTGSIAPTTWVSRGPQNCGGRTRSLLIDPTNTNTLYAGSASGGIWKSTNGGATWVPLDDFMANINIFTMVMDPLHPNILYAGTGESLSSISAYGDGLPGAGVFKSTDSGATWTQLSSTQNWPFVNRLAMQPGTSGVLLSANVDGIWRSSDGGASWSKVLADPVGSSFVVAFNPNNANQAVADGVAHDSGGYFEQLYYSGDGGQNWTAVTTMPTKYYNAYQGIDVSWGISGYVYVNLGIPSGGTVGEIWRSTDSGVTYTRMSGQGVTDCTYHCAVWASPTSANTIVIGGVINSRSTDGGATFTVINAGDMLTDQPHPDTHLIVNDPVSTNKVYVLNDGGIYRTNDITTASTASGWSSLNATYQTTQYYGGAGNAISFGPLVGGTQDNGTLRVSLVDETSPSVRSATTANQWSFGGDGGYVAIDPANPTFMYGEYQYMEIFRSTSAGETGSGIDITSGLSFGSSNAELFIAPLVIDPNIPTTLLAGGGTALWRTTNANSGGGPSWSSIWTNPFSNYISAVATAKSDSNIIWLGFTGGQIEKSTNGLAGSPTFTAIDTNSGGTNPLPDRYVNRIYVDSADPNLVYVALGGYSILSPSPSNLYRSTDGGTTWSSAGGSGTTALPYVPIRGIARHPRNQQQLYVATDIGIYESQDGGATWSSSQQGPADVAVDEISFVTGSELLLAATHGRGLWTADVSAVQSYSPTGVHASATFSTSWSIGVTWNALAGAASYQVMRSVSGSTYFNSGSPQTGTTFTDPAFVSANTTYLYKVKAKVNGIWTDLSAPDLATTVAFTDDNALGGKPVSVLYLNEMRTAVNAVMTAAGQSPAFNPSSSLVTVLTTDITDLRTALVSAYARIGMPSPTFAETLSGTTPIKASHFQEVRDATK